MSVLEIQNLCKTYRGKRGQRVEALRDFSLSVEEGEVLGFLGPNGAGKSTTIRIVMNLLRRDAGDVTLLGEPHDTPYARSRIGFLPENPAFYDFLNADEYLSLVGKAFGLSGQRLSERKTMVLERLSLKDARKRLIRTFSKGMVQRLGLAQCILHDPDFYILDEPMSGLDPMGRVLVKDIICELKHQGKSVFFSTHVTSDVEQICDRVAVISKGELKLLADVDDMLRKGLKGYLLHYVTSQGEKVVLETSATDLSMSLKKVATEGGYVELVEPRRHSIEDVLVKIL